MSCEAAPNANNEFVTYKRRYVTLLLLFVSLVIVFYQTVEYSSNSFVLTYYYGVSYEVINSTGIFSNLCFIIFFYPISMFISKYGFRRSMILGSFINAVGAILKCVGNLYSLFWLLLLGQFLVSTIPLLYLSSLPLFAASWFKCKEVASVFGIANIAISVGLLASHLPTGLIFNGDLSIERVRNSLTLMSVTTASISILTYIVVVFLVEDKPPTSPSLAELNRTKYENKASIRELFQNRNALLLILSYAASNGILDIVVVTLSYSVMSIFNDNTFVLTVAGILLNVSGIPGSYFTGIILERFPKYKFNHVVYSNLFVVLVSAYIFSLYTANNLLLYISTFLIGYVSNALVVLLLDYLVEVSYPFPESVSFSVTETIGFFPALLFVPPITYMTTKYGAVLGNCIIIPIVALNLIISFFVKEDLKRKNADESSEEIKQWLLDKEICN